MAIVLRKFENSSRNDDDGQDDDMRTQRDQPVARQVAQLDASRPVLSLRVSSRLDADESVSLYA